MKSHRLVLPQLLSLTLFIAAAHAADLPAGGVDVARGRYIVSIGACNDCHTPKYPESDGIVPEREWLTGSSVGFRGPWGTTYPRNLRLYLQDLTEAQWLERARQPMRPPMPWFNLRDMSDADLRAVYRYVRALGPAGMPAPEARAPGAAVTTPYYDFVPRNLPKQAKQ